MFGDFIAYFGKQPLPFKHIGIIQWFPSGLGKDDHNWENIGHFWIGKREEFGCTYRGYFWVRFAQFLTKILINIS